MKPETLLLLCGVTLMVPSLSRKMAQTLSLACFLVASLIGIKGAVS